MAARALTLSRSDLDEALSSRQINLLYQPVFSLTEKALSRVEALARWDHPRFGTMLPAVFLPAFETEGRLTALTRRVVERAASEFGAWPERGDVALSINLAAADCSDPSLPETVSSVLKATRIDPSRFIFECPVRLIDASPSRKILAELKDLGVRLAAELMSRSDDLDLTFDIAAFDEIKVPGRGLLRAARNNHLASLQQTADLIRRAEAEGALVTAIGAENEVACQAFKTLGFHLVQANVISSALTLEELNEAKVTASLEALDRTHASEEEEEQTESGAEPDESLKSRRRELQGEALRRAAERKIEAAEEEVSRQKGALAMQRKLAERFGEDTEAPEEKEGMDIQQQKEALMAAESKAGLLMRTDLASASLGYGASPLRSNRRAKSAILVVDPSENNVRGLSREPEVARAIADVLDALPDAVEAREKDLTDTSADPKADKLDEVVAELPEIEPEEAHAGLNLGPIEDELLELAGRLRYTQPKRKNFLTRKYRLKVTHFWPRPWRRAYDRMVAARASDRSGLAEEDALDAFRSQRSEEDTVPVVPLSADDVTVAPVPSDKGAGPAGEGSQPLDGVEALRAGETRE
jgi:EAL domain-containing protein (putative c-di-GMP-specific phosphodiesterase class I)